MSSHWSKSTKEYMGRMHFNYLIAVCDNADKNCPQALWAQGGKRLHWPFEDPAAFEGSEDATLEKFRQVRDQIEARVRSWVAELEPA